MVFIETPLAGAFVIKLEPFQDERGLFARTFCQKEFEQIGHTENFVQFNHSMTVAKGCIRGMHFQKPPFAEIKLIRCIKGKVWDVIVDIRQNSMTFLKWFGVELSAENQKMIYIPKGFAHGFQTLEPNTELIYHHTAFYTPSAEGGLKYNDPKLKIDWKLTPEQLSKKDQEYNYINENFKGIVIS